MVAASSAAPVDLGKVIEAPPAVPKLSVPVSQGTSGGVLLHKVQPVYPAGSAADASDRQRGDRRHRER